MQELLVDKLFYIIPAIFTAAVGYFFWIRKNQNIRFINDIKESMELTISPLYHDLRKIKKNEKNSIRYEENRKNSLINIVHLIPEYIS